MQLMRAQAMDTASSEPVLNPTPSTITHATVHYESNPFHLIKPTINAFKLCWLRLVLVMMGTFVLLFGLSALMVIAFRGLGLAVIAVFLIFLPLLPLASILIGSFVGWIIIKSVIEAARGNKISHQAALPPSAGAYFRFVWTVFLLGLIVVFGFLLFIIPGIIFLGWFGMAPFLNVDQGISGVGALKRSRELTQGRTIDVLGAFFLGSLGGILKFIPVVGPAAALIVSVVLIPTSAVRYVSLIELKAQPGWDSVPTHPLNYLVIIVGLIFGGFSTAQNFKANQQVQQSPLENPAKPY